MNETKRERGSTIQRILETTEFISQHDGQYNTDQVIKKLDYPPVSANKLFADMKSAGFLQKSILGRLTLGKEFRDLAHAALSHKHFKDKRMMLLNSLSEIIGETCGISLPSGANMIYFERAQTNWPLQIHLPPGSHVPMTATASGKLYLSELPSSAQQTILQNIGLERFTRNTIVDMGDLLKDLQTIKVQKYATDNEEFIEGMSTIAVPIKNDQMAFGYLFCHAPSFRKPLNELLEHLPAMNATAEKIMKTMIPD
jgi:IclR family acetate operon transcriptional repressor